MGYKNNKDNKDNKENKENTNVNIIDKNKNKNKKNFNQKGLVKIIKEENLNIMLLLMWNKIVNYKVIKKEVLIVVLNQVKY